jgi:hypothetical protein
VQCAGSALGTWHGICHIWSAVSEGDSDGAVVDVVVSQQSVSKK